ncbi:hypothetical protein L3X38_018748 [Prunus dulcis]|uniref:RNase H type-1 domain-containing protein n=2 Tax=Prunus dulcis TaxID=3755 RepID=A0AAD4WAB4_PRUDU|nr:hypothetical protein L3X38_018748 [Prunus dulcis]
MSKAPLLSTPEIGETLMICLLVSNTAVSLVLIQPHDGAEHLVHYVSKALQDAKAQYPDLEKLAFALVVSTKRFQPYFQAHTIHAFTNQPLRDVLQKPETSGKVVKWAIKLGEFDIHYKPRPATKGHVVVDFLSEFTKPQPSATPLVIAEPTPPQPSSTSQVILEYAFLFNFHTSNNISEYEALLAGLWLAKEMGSRQIQIFNDSQLVVHQVNQDFSAKDTSMTAYFQHIHRLLKTFEAYSISQIPRYENIHVNALVRLASAVKQGISRNIPIEFLDKPSTQAPVICTIDHSPAWKDPTLQSLQH